MHPSRFMLIPEIKFMAARFRARTLAQLQTALGSTLGDKKCQLKPAQRARYHGFRCAVD
ncbi:hypothetical protein GPECTOR_195g329 [Gonium pectorale]|uniref:Uncharacterized protein n=1 Tax=Gonium pectorale TaxID=33097 RepID=A0A150FX22_GONPE|nr:hypothetical protein GPECTOR_195g329 [Gonium pectorale]|eukprot:KXZ42149.1 hypothetical protein GPECTOR_195g329 [Gonium pectorale]